jgi:acyl-CoA synthetase (AMP-forming)/AMP-acid ligase II
MDEDGFLYFVGRSDDIIKTRGEKVSPVEVEDVLHGIEGIKDALVLGVPDETFGQTITAFVVIEPDSDVDIKKIKKHCLTHLENFMIPKDIIVIDEMPKTPNGKKDKKSLKEQYQL